MWLFAATEFFGRFSVRMFRARIANVRRALQKQSLRAGSANKPGRTRKKQPQS